MLVSALMRRVQQAGGNAVVLAKGDEAAGAVLMLCAERGAVQSVRERIFDGDAYRWQPVGPESPFEREEYLSRRRARDRDLWLIELDIANAERFADETTGIG